MFHISLDTNPNSKTEYDTGRWSTVSYCTLHPTSGSILRLNLTFVSFELNHFWKSTWCTYFPTSHHISKNSTYAMKIFCKWLSEFKCRSSGFWFWVNWCSETRDRVKNNGQWRTGTDRRKVLGSRSVTKCYRELQLVVTRLIIIENGERGSKKWRKVLGSNDVGTHRWLRINGLDSEQHQQRQTFVSLNDRLYYSGTQGWV